jgi:hypothetical protein
MRDEKSPRNTESPKSGANALIMAGVVVTAGVTFGPHCVLIPN